VIAEALKWLARVPHPGTHDRRRLTIEGALRHEAMEVRDGAILGLWSIEDPASIPAVREALPKEAVPWLRDEMEKLLQQLAHR